MAYFFKEPSRTFSEYLLGLENQMFQTLRAMLPMMAG